MLIIGGNALSASVRLGVLVASNRIGIHSDRGYEPLTNEDNVFLFCGCVAAFVVGLITIKDAMPRVVPMEQAPEPLPNVQPGPEAEPVADPAS